MKAENCIKGQKSDTSEYSAWDGNNRITNSVSTILIDTEFEGHIEKYRNNLMSYRRRIK